MEFKHDPVMLREVIDGLNVKENGTYIDATVGGAGHSIEIAKLLNADGLLIGIDQDPEALKAAAKKLSDFECSVKLVSSNFSDIADVVDHVGAEHVDGILMDIGVSSYQLDESSRGFTYREDVPLDMRMNPSVEITAAYIVNKEPEDKLCQIIGQYGEERWAARIAKFICERRKEGPIATTGELVDIIRAAVPKAARQEGIHPARRTFQALRIAVNDELGSLERGIKGAVKVLGSEGRLAILSYHSLEDRIVKQTFKQMEEPCTCPREMPVCICGLKPVIRVITRKPELPSDAEIERNPRARSAKLRIAQKL